ncbi:MAG: bifunctional diaminohydroxyphosphoribosylaminopyrimidine deaminase/5-amino-6-(5-phosphoribosylamino)uracil reductase RibD [Lentisphaerae bacterium]|nr:bifunctional diaminohydroxyphosphoribosylaminopyrimidine deaminase/5-amino-6-(5-phosphoribosylamino)uracil reductase RibD [Lentisphaerota bacterium]
MARPATTPAAAADALREDRRLMRLAIRLARAGEGHTRPNPPVGAVVVLDGQVIGRGTHRAAGQPHAEVEAIRACRRNPRGATLYVTLEPCSTTGRTPPCTDLIAEHGLRRVCIGCIDPNPRHAGRGIDVLRQGGIAVETGLCEADCRRLIAPFAKRITTGLPWVTLKLALTLDGRLADRDGRSKWITGEPARAWVQQLRRRADAILVGAGTVAADDPELRCRLPGAGDAWRVVIDGAGRLPADRRLFTDAHAATTIMATTPAGARRLRQTLPAGTAATLWTFRARRDGTLNLADVLRRLSDEHGVMHVVCEGGGRLAGRLAAAGLVDTFAFVYAPCLLGDAAAVPAVDGPRWLLGQAPRGQFTEVRRLGGDLLVLAQELQPDAARPPRLTETRNGRHP